MTLTLYNDTVQGDLQCVCVFACECVRDHLSMQWFTDVGNVLPNEEANGPERAESLSESDPRPTAEGGGTHLDGTPGESISWSLSVAPGLFVVIFSPLFFPYLVVES